MFLRKLLALVAVMLLFVQQSSAQVPSTSCEVDGSVIQAMLCSDPDLSAADVRMARTYYRLLATLPEDRVRPLADEQVAWSARRLTSCGIPDAAYPARDFGMKRAFKARACLADMTERRADELSAIVPPDALSDFNKPPGAALTEDSRWFARLSVEFGSRREAMTRRRELQAQFPALSFAAFPPRGGNSKWAIYIASYTSEPKARRVVRLLERIGVPQLAMVSAFPASPVSPGWASVPDSPSEDTRECVREGAATYRDLLACTGIAFTPETLRSCLLDGRCDLGLKGAAADAVLASKGLDWTDPVKVPGLPVDPDKVVDCSRESVGSAENLTACLTRKAVPPVPRQAQDCSALSPRPEAFGRCLVSGLNEPLRGYATCLISTSGGGDELSCITGFLGSEEARRLDGVRLCLGRSGPIDAENAVRCALASLPELAPAIACFDAADAGSRTACLLGLHPEFRDAKRKLDCVAAPGTRGSVLAMCAPLFGVGVPAPVARCIATAEEERAELACIPADAARQLRCFAAADDLQRRATCLALEDPGLERLKAVLCVGGSLPGVEAAISCGIPQMDEPTRAVVGCLLRDASNLQAVLVCAAASFLGEEERRIMGCAVGAVGYLDFGLCILGVSVNTEVATIAGCAADSGFDPMATVSCSAGLLTRRELERCASHGIGGRDGCFGESNTVTQFIKAQFLDPQSINALAKGLETGLRDFGKAAQGIGQKAKEGVDRLPKVRLGGGTEVPCPFVECLLLGFP